MEKIFIEELDRDLIQRLDMEQTARKNLISFLLNEKINNDDKLEQFKNEYIEYFMAFEEQKKFIQKKYLDNQHINYTNWNLNYNTCELTYI